MQTTQKIMFSLYRVFDMVRKHIGLCIIEILRQKKSHNNIGVSKLVTSKFICPALEINS